MFSIIKKLITPKSPNKDVARREFILNILLVGSLMLVLAGLVENLIYFNLSNLSDYQYHGINPLITFAFAIFLAGLFVLSKIGKVRLSAFIFIYFIFLSSAYTSFYWGIDVPQALLMYSVVIVMSGILINTKFAFITTLLIGLILAILSFLQVNNILPANVNWRNQPQTFGDTLVQIVTLAIIATVSWLFNREMERALRRAWRSEAAVKRQRDKLEITVEKRTKELKRIQAEKMAQLYRFAEFGKSASGLFHDLANPLTLVSLNLKRLNRKVKQPKLVETEVALQRAITGTKRLENFIYAARKQIQHQEVLQEFSIKDEINQAIQMVEHRARKSSITIVFKPHQNIKIFGNPVKFNQLITNLLTNAIDAYDRVKKRRRLVEIRMEKVNSNVRLEVQDWGCGISQADLPHIFDPLFTTKGIEKGTGIGLSICKDIIEKGFEGNYLVESKKGVGTNFTIEFPIKKYARQNN